MDLLLWVYLMPIVPAVLTPLAVQWLTSGAEFSTRVIWIIVVATFLATYVVLVWAMRREWDSGRMHQRVVNSPAPDNRSAEEKHNGT
jgi:hypothetical protein